MKKIFSILTIMTLAVNIVAAQQIKRQTLASQGRVKAITGTPSYRMSWTAGSCPGCNTLHPTSPANAGYLRQGFQQPPNRSNNAADCPPLYATFDVTPIVTPTCGTKFDFNFTGQSVAGMTVLWDFGDGALPRTSTALNPMGVSYATVGAKFISLTVKKGNCSDSKARSVNISTNQIGFSAQSAITSVKCFGSATGAVKLTLSGGSGTKTFKWSNGATTQDLANVVAGKYSVTATDGAGCQFSLDTAVSQPTAGLSYRDSTTFETCYTYKDGSVQLNVSGGTTPYKYLWSNGSTAARIDSLSAGSYRFSITDANGCRLDSLVDVKVRCKLDTSKVKGKPIFDIITPNGDGLNDQWIVNGLAEFPKNEVFIYNRWGQLVWNTKVYRDNWAGTNNNGEELPSAAYYYVIMLNDDKQTVWTGSVTVVR